jgi:hypothetical protein
MSTRRTERRPRRYVSKRTLNALRPLFRYSERREAYVLRVIGSYRGPVLKPDRRRDGVGYGGPERRRVGAVHLALN